LVPVIDIDDSEEIADIALDTFVNVDDTADSIDTETEDRDIFFPTALSDASDEIDALALAIFIAFTATRTSEEITTLPSCRSLPTTTVDANISETWILAKTILLAVADISASAESVAELSAILNELTATITSPDMTEVINMASSALKKSIPLLNGSLKE
jgi:hypothetical protein